MRSPARILTISFGEYGGGDLLAGDLRQSGTARPVGGAISSVAIAEANLSTTAPTETAAEDRHEQHGRDRRCSMMRRW